VPSPPFSAFPMTTERRSRSRSPRGDREEKPVAPEEVKLTDLAGDDDDEEEECEEIKQCLRLDATTWALEKEAREKIMAIQRERDVRLKDLAKQRLEALKGPAVPGQGTPSVENFWLTVLQQSEEFMDQIYEHDEPVLEALEDITTEYMDETREIFKITFHFVENEYFTNKTLTKTYQCEPIGEHFPENLECNGITCDKIEWKEGKNVTVEYKKVKGKKSKEEPQESFFRWFFRSVGGEHDFPDDVELETEENSDGEEEEETEEDAVDRVIEEDWDAAVVLRDHIIPHAVMYYQGEFVEDDDDEDEDEDEEEDSDEDSDEEEEDDEEEDDEE